jgi:RHS repeat-associated protein
MTSHQDKGILEIRYNHLNLPNYNRFNQSAIRTDLNGNNTTIYKNSTYLYRADGVKLKKIHQYFTGRNNGNDVFKTTEYLDGFQYETESIGGRPAPPTPKFFPTAEGYYNFENNKYIYNYTDHLGNVRLSYFKGSNGVEVLEENNYYPFGLKHEGYNPTAGNSSYQYKYNGKELQETGMYDYGARFYMPDIGRWGVVDPLAEKYPSLSPYVYVANNPVCNRS